MEQKHSGLGIASFIISLVSGVLIFILIGFIGVLEVLIPDGIGEESLGFMLTGLFFFVFLFTSLVALGLGISGLYQKDRKKIFAVLGTVFSAAILIGSLSLIMTGAAVE